MNMPNFTAEASLYKKAKNHFRIGQGFSVNNTSAVIPQIIRTIDINRGCTLFCDCNPASGVCSCDATLCPFLPVGDRSCSVLREVRSLMIGLGTLSTTILINSEVTNEHNPNPRIYS